MHMTGPGGTGKTHIVKAVKGFMAFYHCGHKLWFIAPTGSVASLIDGITIHKGLNIEIKSRDKGKSCEPGDSTDSYNVTETIPSNTEVQNGKM